jgi:hypothetical protein
MVADNSEIIIYQSTDGKMNDEFLKNIGGGLYWKEPRADCQAKMIHR